MNTKIRTHHVLCALAAACLAACGGGNDTTMAAASPEAAQSPVRAVTVAAATSGSTVVVRARATLAAGVGATMVVRAEGMILGSVSVNNVGTSQDYSFAAPMALGSGAQVDVVFVNDGVTVVNGVRTEDRNLIVDSITVDGRAPITANASGVVVDKGDGSAAFDGVDTVPGQSGLWWNGALRFVLPGSASPTGHTLTVRASASLAGGVGAQMMVRADGQVVGNAAVANVGAAQAYTFALATAPAAGSKVDVAFVNDGVTVDNGVRTEDRNLYVESIALDAGTPIKSSDAGVTLDRGAGDAAYDGVDVIPGQVALAWNGALRFVLPGTPPPPPVATHTLKLRARATTLGGVGAAVTLRVDGQPAGTVQVNAVGTAQDYSVTTNLAVVPGSLIDVVYTNDAASVTESRDLFVESLTLDAGAPMLPSDGGVLYDKGDAAAAFDSADILPGQSLMAWNGALRFPIDNQSVAQTVTVRAGGVSAGGIAPKMELWVNGFLVSDAVGSTVTSVPNSTAENYTFNVSTRPGSRIDVHFTNPGTSTDSTGTVQRSLVVESIAVGASTPISSTAPGVIFDAGTDARPMDLAAWRDGLNVKAGLTHLTEAGALRFPLGMLNASTATGTPVASLSTAQKITITRLAYATLASLQAQRASLLQFPEVEKARAPLIPLTTTLPAAATLCPLGGAYQASLDGIPLGAGTAVPNSGTLQMDWTACATSWANASGTSVSEFRYIPTPDPLGGPTIKYPAAATTQFRNAMHWTETLQASRVGAVNLPTMDVDLTGLVWTSSSASSTFSGRYMDGKEWFRLENLLVADRTQGVQARVKGSWVVSSSASYSAINGASSMAVPVGLQFTLDGVAYDIDGTFRMNQLSILKEDWALIDLTVTRGGVLVGHLTSWASPLMIEVDGQRLPW